MASRTGKVQGNISHLMISEVQDNLIIPFKLLFRKLFKVFLQNFNLVHIRLSFNLKMFFKL